ncbi:hypothetical protein PG989_004544 [Apiospora arundinis]
MKFKRLFKCETGVDWDDRVTAFHKGKGKGNLKGDGFFRPHTYIEALRIYGDAHKGMGTRPEKLDIGIKQARTFPP